MRAEAAAAGRSMPEASSEVLSAAEFCRNVLRFIHSSSLLIIRDSSLASLARAYTDPIALELGEAA
jgi:hypothetical protein